jgi:acyl-CoA synthetase (AMP-forming)/AMP-acid ligase II
MATNLPQLLESAARSGPRNIALEWHGSRWAYEDLLASSACVAGALARLGIGRGERVVLLTKNCPQYAALYYGTLRAGCVAVPLNALEQASVLARQIRHSGARLVFSDAGLAQWAQLAAELDRITVPALGFRVEDGPQALSRFIEALNAFPGQARDTPCDAVPLEPDALACILYTSGTTADPKGVMLSHGNLASNTASISAYLELTRADVGLCTLPFHFSYGNSVLQTHLAAGARLVIEEGFAFPHAVVQQIQDRSVTGFAGVPSTYAMLFARVRLEQFDLRALRYLTQAGGPMPGHMVRRLRSELPHAQLYLMYGQTEATARLTYLPPARLEDKPGSVGIAIPGVEISIRRADGLALAAGEIGEVCARGPNVMLGYWRNAAATAQALRRGWLHTGDLGYLDAEGYLYIVGRAVDMIKVGAYRVSPQEVEEVIGALPGVEDVCVSGMPDTLLGQVIKAVIVPSPGHSLDERAVKAYCRGHLAPYKRPQVVEFTNALPRTTSGKLQRHKVAAP